MAKAPVASPPLTSVVQDKCSNLKLVNAAPIIPAEGKLTTEETTKVESINFPKELDFTVDPKTYLSNSKEAFKNFVNGLPKELPYDDLWKHKPHDPHAVSDKMGDVDVKCLAKSV